MKNILFITKASLNSAKRGTPLRMISVAKQIAKANNILVVASSVPANFALAHQIYPQGNLWQNFFYFLKLIKQKKIDIIFANTEMEIVLPVLLKIFTGKKIVIDTHGLYAEEMYYEGLMSLPKKYVVGMVIRFLLLFYDLIFFCSDKLLDYYAAVKNKAVIIYNGIDQELFTNLEPVSPKIFTIAYAGNLKKYQGFEYLLLACQKIRQQNLFSFRLNLVVSSGTSDIAERLQAHNLLDITDLHFKLDNDQVAPIINRSSVLVIPRPSLTLTEYAYPSKMPGDLLTGIPTIITKVGPVDKLLGQADVSILIEADDISNNLVKALQAVHDMSALDRALLGKRAVNFVKNNLTWDILGTKINESLITIDN